MKSFLRTFIISAIAGAIIWAINFGRGNGAWYIVWSSLVAGIVFGLLSAAVVRYRENRVADSGPNLDDEVVLHERRADHEGMHGWLYLTSKRILFEGYPTDATSPEISTLFDRYPHDASDSHLVSMPILQISEVVPHSIGVASGLRIVLDDGRVLTFFTEDTAGWLDEIATVRQKYLDAPQFEDKKLFPPR